MDRPVAVLTMFLPRLLAFGWRVIAAMEAASIIVLLGAQVIAELERGAAAGLPWHQPPGR